MLSRHIFLGIFLFLNSVEGNKDVFQYEENLIDALMNNYNRLVRPVSFDTSAVNITFGIALPKLLKVDELNELIVAKTWVRQYWKDPSLTWNESEYGGIARLVIKPDDIWIPDISLLNNAEGNTDSQSDDSRVIVTSSGDITWLSPSIFKSACGIDITYFPIDDQICTMRFGSWTFNNKFLNIQVDGPSADLNMYADNGEWILLNASSEMSLRHDPCCDAPFSEIIYRIHLRRRTFYYMMNFIVPCALIAALTLLVFLLPPESGERMSFGITVLLSFTVLILMLKEKMPPTSMSVPIIAVYYACTIIEVSCALGLCCLMLRFYHQNPPTATIPPWMKVVILNWFARLVCLQQSAERVKQEFVLQNWREANIRNSRKDKSGINILTDNILKKEKIEVKREEWRMAAIVLNRVFVVMYIFTVFVTLIAIFIKVPRIREGNL